jgi:hypothetical protein
MLARAQHSQELRDHDGQPLGGNVDERGEGKDLAQAALGDVQRRHRAFGEPKRRVRIPGQRAIQGERSMPKLLSPRLFRQAVTRPGPQPMSATGPPPAARTS